MSRDATVARADNSDRAGRIVNALYKVPGLDDGTLHLKHDQAPAARRDRA